ncbi:MAG: hypothetical protein A2X36_15095 [Elusimicrobia bacterium GWA2_69_24]|nr:MAG: hypothetical protein A2X36_15095 [Elusimicrobia bacterium GWA2_69_24]
MNQGQELADIEVWHWWHQTRYRLARAALLGYAPGHRKAHIGELDCGSGGLLRFLQGRGFSDLTGFESSAEAVGQVRRRGIECSQADLTGDFRLKGAPFDALVAMDLLNQVPDQGRLLANVRENLRPGGAILLTVPAYLRITRSGLRDLLANAGFEPVRVSHCFAFLSLLSGGSPTPPEWLNGVLLALGRCETTWLRWWDLPMGSALVAVGRKPRDLLS